MAQGKDYQVVEARNPEILKAKLNELAAQGYELVEILPYGQYYLIVAAKTIG